MVSALIGYRMYSSDLTQTLNRISSQAYVERESQYYEANIGKVTSVDEFLGDYRLYAYAMKAYGLEDQINSQGLMRKVLESDLSDSASFANKLTDTKFRTFAAAFNFAASTTSGAQSESQTDVVVDAYSDRLDRSAVDAAAKTSLYQDKIKTVASAAELVANDTLYEVAMRSVGITNYGIYNRSYIASVLDGSTTTSNASLISLRNQFTFSAGAPVQTGEQVSTLVYNYNSKTGNAASPQAAQANIDYYASKAIGLTVQVLTTDTRLLDYALTSVGFDLTSYSPDFVANILNGDASTVQNLANVSSTNKQRFIALQNLFTRPGDGTLSQSDEQIQKMADGYLANYKTAITSKTDRATTVYETAIAKVNSVSDLVARDSGGTRTTLNYVLQAFDIDPSTVSVTKIRAVLASDPSDPKSYVSKLGDERFSKLAAAFNFGEDGKVGAQRLAQSTSQQTETGSLYKASFGSDISDAQNDLIKSATESYLSGMAKVYSIDQFVSDRKLTAYALKAYGVEDTKLSERELRKILTSDLGDPKSFANSQTDKAIAKFAAAFNFETDGSISDGSGGVQSGADVLETRNLYLQQTMEEQAGDTNEGARLALYFARKAPDLKSPYDILSDKALLEVVQTTLGLSSSMSNMEIEDQARVIKKAIDFSDFQDDKKLSQFVTRFTATYDANNTNSSANPVLALFGASNGSSRDLLSYLY